ncbi:MAG: hypothetical protein MJY71_02545 [Bacteroidaceae bacterium]|nr:hypothetical protein [Bacteroidaceae bacterium]
MKATKVQELYGGRVRIYRLSEPIKKGKSDWSGNIDIVKDMTMYLHDRIKQEYRDALRPYFTNPDGVNFVGISDAIDHIERLAFPAFPTPDGYSFVCDSIAGKHTMLTTGGNPSMIYDDAVYLRFLCHINGLKWEGMTDNNQ